MKYAYKTELKPTLKQAQKIKESIGICRYLYNRYIEDNLRLYKLYQRGFLDAAQSYFMTAKDFDKYINNKVKIKPEFAWLNNCGSKPRKKAIVNAELAYKRYFSGKAPLPKFKCRDSQDIALYFPKNNIYDWIIERHRIKIPTLGFVRLKEYGYLPVGAKAINGNVSYRAGRYFVSITVEQKRAVKETAISYLALNLHISKNEHPLLKRIKRAKKVLQHKRKQGSKHSNNQEKQKLAIQKLEQRLDFLLNDKFNKIIAAIIAENPTHVILPKLTKTAAKDKLLLRKLYKFRNKLLLKCNLQNITLQYKDKTNILAANIKYMDVILDIN